MRQGRRAAWTRARVAIVGGIVLGLFSTGLGATPAAAGPDKVSEQDVINVLPDTPIPTGNPSCPRVPGVVKEGKVWSTFYGDVDGSRYITLRFSLFTRYKVAVATAALAFPELFGRPANCQELYGFEGKGTVGALYEAACLNPWVIAGRRPNRWCALAALPTAPPSLDVEMEACRTPRFNHGYWGPAGYAEWHNLRDSRGNRVKLDKIDLLEEGGFDWVPGTVNANVYLDDFEMGFGMSPLDPSINDRYVGFGKVQTPFISEVAVAIYDDWARRLGINPEKKPLKAHRRVQTAINNGQNIRGVGNAAAAWKDIRQAFCDASKWVMQALGDGNIDNNGDREPDRLAFPQPDGSVCDAGFALYQPQSALGVGQMFEQFVAKGNDGRVPQELKTRSAFLPMIIREAYRNEGLMKLRDPFSAHEQPPGETCPVELNLGIGRNRHFVQLARNLEAILG
ncbi:MAG: hypothetical protein ACT4OX_01595 [Actinomycetota bacterium]